MGSLQKVDLLELLDEPFRVAKYQALESATYLAQRRAQAEALLGPSASDPALVSTPSAYGGAGTSAIGAKGATGGHRGNDYARGQSLGQSHLMDTLNSRDKSWKGI